MGRRCRRGLAVWVAAAVAGSVLAVPAEVSAAAAAPACTGVAPSEAEASALAVACDEQVFVDSSRTELAQVVAQPDGRLRFESAVVPQRTRRTGRWAEIDLQLAAGSDNRWRPAMSVADVAFSGGGAGPLVTLRRDGKAMMMSWSEGALPAPEVAADSATYRNVLTDVDLVVRATRTGFSHALIVKSAAAAANPAVRQIRFGLSGDVEVSPGPGGGLRATAGSSVFATAEPAVMWDSRTGAAAGTSARGLMSGAESTPAGAGDAARVAPVEVELSGTDLVLRPDVALLQAPEAVFPLFIDPAWSVYKSKWAYATNNGSSNTDYSTARVGLSPETGALYRSFFEFPTTANGVSLKGKHVESARVQMTLTHSHSCDDTVSSMYFSSAINATMKASWSKMLIPTFLDEASGHANEAGGCQTIQPNMTMNFSGSTVTAQLQTAATKSWNNITVGFTARAANGSGESTQGRWKKFLPNDAKLYVDYDSKPGAPNGLQVAGVACPSSGALTIGTLTPSFSAVFPDADGADSLTGTFEWIEVPAGGMSTVTDASPTRKTPPPNKTGVTPNSRATSNTVTVTTGTTYAFRAKATDKAPYSLTGDWSGWCQFSADTTKPPVTARVVTLPAGPGLTGRVRIESTATDVTRFMYGWDAATKVVTAQGTNPKFAEVEVTAASFGRNVLLVKAVDAILNEGYGSVEFTVARPSSATAKWGLETYPGMSQAAALADGQPTPINSSLTATNVTWSDDVHMVGGQTATFNGTSSYAQTSGQVLDTSKSYSVAAWVRLTDRSADRTVVTKDASGSASLYFQYQKSTDRWLAQMPSATSGTITWWNATSSSVPQTNVWTHLTCVYDAVDDTLKLYVNGKLESTVNGVVGFNDATRPFWIGRSGSTWWQGNLADVQVFDRVLVPHDFTGQLAADPLSGGFNEPGMLTPIPAGNWDFENAQSCYVTDFRDSCEAPDSVTAWARWLALTKGSEIAAGYGGGQGLWLDYRYFPDDGFDENTQEYARSAIKLAPHTDPDGNELNTWQEKPVLRTDDSFTVSAWVMLSSPVGMRTAVSQRGTHESAFWLKYQSDVGKWQFNLSDEDATTTSTISVRSTNAAESEVWTHLTGVYDAGRKEIRLYVNGVIEGVQAVPFTPMTSNGPLLVGRALWHDQVIDQWTGGIDDVAVFQGAMTDTAVFNLYNSRIPATPGTNLLVEGDSLTAGQYLRSDVGNYQLLMQADGNLVLSQAGFPIWDTGTWGNSGAYATLQTDGNLVVYRSDGTAMWDTSTAGTAASQLVLRDNGDLVLLDPGGTVLWHR
ncbi:LamG-like jellyroll fold domain-containing protein [Micromonospora profundi]|uniref:LamG-like jellyroll fold domain-containing protein n=1 Tax=Micromonospora profundi TaxID=1420889 RepID=UPI003649F6BF